MVQITKENGMQSAGVPFAWVEVQYPDKAQWDETGFYDMVEQHVAALREQYREYVRASARTCSGRTRISAISGNSRRRTLS